MKKCASCTKDLPDAALHCVFCGAKQAPAPAVQQSMAKTAFGYSQNEAQEQLRAQARSHAPSAPPPPAPAYNPPPPAPVYNPPPYSAPLPGVAPMQSAPPPAMAPTLAPPPPAAPPQQPMQQGGYVPKSAANAATLFVAAPAGLPAPQPAPQPMPQTMLAPGVPAPSVAPAPMPVPQPLAMQPQPQPQPAPRMQIPAAQPPPYLASQTATRAGRPFEPWRQSLRLMMFLWGVALLAAFATPLTTPELSFNWTLILEGQRTARLPPLMLAAVGLLSVILATIPMPSVVRGLLATLLGLAGVGVPIALVGVPPWLALVPMVGMLVLIPALLVRNEYRDALLPRFLVTLGAAGVLLPFLLPQGGAIPLVSLFKQLIDLPGMAKVQPALQLGLITIVVMTLLAWLPAPITGGAVLWAFVLMLWPLVTHVAQLVVAGNVVEAIMASPNAALLGWVAGGAGLGSAYLVLVGYGLASVVGKQLE